MGHSPVSILSCWRTATLAFFLFVMGFLFMTTPFFSVELWGFPNFFFALESSEESNIFCLFASFIGSIVILFSFYYMDSSEHFLFSNTLFVFLSFILLLALSNNLFSIFWGWEGVGLLSFLLIGWSGSRSVSAFSSKKAVIYNRFTDFFFLAVFLMEGLSYGNVFRHTSNSVSEWTQQGHFEDAVMSNSQLSFAFIILLMVIGNSAQFMFHPWLTAAMEGPTPVSALLHSSTMVVAGVYLFLNIFFFVSNSGETLAVFVWSSGLTILLSSLAAFFHKDMKNIIALSTTSQLSFILLLASLGFRELAFAHLILHGFFNASIFLMSGVFIHGSSSHHQDVRRTNIPQYESFFFASFLICNFCLMGIPFLGGFFTKHNFLALGVLGSSPLPWFPLRSSGILLGILSAMLTAGYSFRLLRHLMLQRPGNSINSALSLKLSLYCGGSVLSLVMACFLIGEVLMVEVVGVGTTVGRPYWEVGSGEMVSLSSWLSIIILGVGLLLSYGMPQNSLFWWHYGFSSYMNNLLLWNIFSNQANNLESSLENFLFPTTLNTFPLQKIFFKKSASEGFPLFSFVMSDLVLMSAFFLTTLGAILTFI